MDAMMGLHVTLPCFVAVYRIASNQHAMMIAGIAWRLGLHPETSSDTMQVRPRCSFVLTSDPIPLNISYFTFVLFFLYCVLFLLYY